MKDTFEAYLRRRLKEGMEVTFGKTPGWKVAIMEDYLSLTKPGVEVIIPFSAIHLIRDVEGKVYINE